MGFITKFLSSTIAKTVIGWWKAVTRDKLNRDLGASQAHQEVQKKTIEELKDHAEIEQESISVNDAMAGFRLRVTKPRKTDR